MGRQSTEAGGIPSAPVRGRRGGIAARLLATLIAAACGFALGAPHALADGDPASEYLPTGQVFMFPASLNAPASAERRLRRVVSAANASGFHVRVAVIAGSYDLGPVPQLWRKPQRYARFLGTELASAYTGRILTVMPNGVGFYWHGHPAASADAALASVGGGSGASELGAAVDAVERLASAAGVSLAGAAVGHRAATRTGGSGPLVPVLVALAAIAALLAAGLALLERRRRTAKRAPSAQTRPGRVSLRVALPVFALLAAGGIAAGILLRGAQRAGGGAPAQQAAVVGTPFTWGPGKRPAPAFTLTGSDGRPISLSQFHGHTVLVTFIDPTCRNLCPLVAQVLGEAERALPPSRRPEIVAVSVDVPADSHKTLVQDERHWNVPQWHWAIGSRSSLASVWGHYGAEVEVQSTRIAGVTTRSVNHSELAYLIDAHGNERALFGWPFTAQDVERTLRGIGA